MAGTRLYIQGLALLELVVLAAWSFYFGLCRNGDALCMPEIWQFLSSDDPPLFQLPSLEPPLRLPLVQVDKQLHPDTGMEWKKNPNTVIVCSQPESPVVQGQTFWRCPPIQPQDPPRVVVRQSSMLIFSKETQLSAIAMPEVSLPFALTVHVVLEQSNNLASKAQAFAASIEEEIAQLEDWHCVEAVEIQMTVLEPYTEKWIVPESSSEETGEVTPSHLPKVTVAQAEGILDMLDLPSSDNWHDLIIYIPALAPEEKSIFQLGNGGTEILMVGGLDASSVHQWLLNKVGIHTENLDSDGSFPTWFEEWYWYSAIQQVSEQVIELYSRTEHLLEAPLELQISRSLKGHYRALVRLRQELEAVLTRKSLQTDFPAEHYAAIFAPLLFPLLLPFLAGAIKELKRYKEKKRNKNEKEIQKAKTD